MHHSKACVLAVLIEFFLYMYQVFALEMVGGQGRGRVELRRHIHASIHLFMPHVRMQYMHFALRLHDTHVCVWLIK